MTMSDRMTIFSLARQAMSAQMVRMNAATSNLANAGSVARKAEDAYRPLRPVFQTEFDRASALASVRIQGLVEAGSAPSRRHDPDHPLADENGDVWESSVDETAEMVEVMESARQYQNLVQAVQTAKQLMLDTIRSR